MKQTHIKDVFFDLDHTLWDFDKNSELTFETIFNRNHPTIATKEFIEKYVPINQACWALYQYDKITHQELRYNRLKHSFDALSYTISDEEIETIADDYIRFLPDNNHLFDGTVELLEYLKPKYNLHIITNGFAEVQFKKLNNSKIGSYFQTITNSEMAGVKKPNPIIFDYALDLAKAKKEKSIMIGDSLEADVQGALDAGLQAIFFNESKVQVEQHIIQINHLLELKKYL
ncbi:noncanonical pyrimidine nucleotidase, YjjG family [Flavobacterium sp. LS1P28]|uniref:YjjG family noncanonical pyrimidine nucleotidase n=1 Tax=unclassified Flavobacterium TaxID=196869 RepID=UPI000F835BE6|nr:MULTISPECIES: YjjG family noncanonical pyrimidine nucleotidase [unclassified Flavobacterium]RTY76773.1 noncanonical pyrimidine nucleotidase, YjjG family [Flavobacterium sp. LS1R10]RTY84308.1 noncanonical pyrimidine nucleotidase, YjjG family [Flavobacterium sp. LS1P28]RTY95563.1 noncanonical pyrimidine nucleotidase, YjjG family [Flavobacterium sp. GSN2]